VSDIERMAAGYIAMIFFGLIIMLVFFSRKRWVDYFKRFSTLQKMAMSFLAGLAVVMMMWGIGFLFIGRKALPVGFILCSSGALPFIALQSRFRSGKLKKSIFSRHAEFDERDYRIGQDAIHAAYLAFWIIVSITGMALYMVAVLNVTLPGWILFLLLPLLAVTVSSVHAVSILLKYRRDNRGIVVDVRE
jgi:hypothetical protein